MSRGRHPSSAAAAARRAAWLAVIALLLQALLPATALATSSLGVREVELCTRADIKVIKVGPDGQPVEPFAGLPCLDCLTALTAAIAPHAPRVEPVVHAEAVSLSPGRSLRRGPPARAPPRPPGQGPPAIA